MDATTKLEWWAEAVGDSSFGVDDADAALSRSRSKLQFGRLDLHGLLDDEIGPDDIARLGSSTASRERSAGRKRRLVADSRVHEQLVSGALRYGGMLSVRRRLAGVATRFTSFADEAQAEQAAIGTSANGWSWTMEARTAREYAEQFRLSDLYAKRDREEHKMRSEAQGRAAVKNLRISAARRDFDGVSRRSRGRMSDRHPKDFSWCYLYFESRQSVYGTVTKLFLPLRWFC